MKTWIILGVLALAGVAGAAPPGGRKVDDPAFAERRAEMEQRAQMMVTLEIAQALELNDADTLKLKQQVAQWDAQRAPLRQQMFDNAQVLRRASKGDTTAYGQVDQAIQKIIDLRAQMQQIDQQMFQQLSKGLPPQKKAKLALAIARMPGAMRGMMRGGGHGGPRGEPDDVQ